MNRRSDYFDTLLLQKVYITKKHLELSTSYNGFVIKR